MHEGRTFAGGLVQWHRLRGPGMYRRRRPGTNQLVRCSSQSLQSSLHHRCGAEIGGGGQKSLDTIKLNPETRPCRLGHHVAYRQVSDHPMFLLMNLVVGIGPARIESVVLELSPDLCSGAWISIFHESQARPGHARWVPESANDVDLSCRDFTTRSTPG